MLVKFISLHIDSFEYNVIVKLSFNVDGVPYSTSSKSSYWPVLIFFINVPCLIKSIKPVCVYHEKFKKPTASFDFLNPFITEIMKTISNGIIINNKTIKFESVQVICDATAKAFILNVKNYSLYYGYNSCTVEDTYINHRMTYLEVNPPLLTKSTFCEKLDEF